MTQPLEAAPDAPIDEAVAELHDDPAQEVRVDASGELDSAAGQLGEPGTEGIDSRRLERGGAGRDGAR